MSMPMPVPTFPALLTSDLPEPALPRKYGVETHTTVPAFQVERRGNRLTCGPGRQRMARSAASML